MKQAKIEFSIGIAQDCDGQEIPLVYVQQGLRDIEAAVTSAFGGCTTLSGQGRWHDPKSRFEYIEDCVVISAVTDEGTALYSPTVKEIVELIKRVLRQRAVAVTISPCIFSVH